MNKRNKRFWSIFAIYVAALVVVAIIIYAVPSLLGIFDSTYVAKYGTVEAKTDVQACILRDEKVYTASKSGKVSRLADDAELVRGGSNVVEISGQGSDSRSSRYKSILTSLGDRVEKNDGKAAEEGYVSYHVDGFEKYGRKTALSMTKKKFQKISTADVKDTPTGSCAKGDPVYRLVTNGDWWMVFYVGEDDASFFKKGSTVRVKIGSKGIDGEIAKVSKSSDGDTKVVVTSNMFLKDTLKERMVSATVTTARADGVIVRKKSIIKKDGVQGVITLDKAGHKQFKPVSIKADNGEECALASDYFMDSKGRFVETINTYDEVVSSPSSKDIREAENING
jgi:hypothetical protein